MKHTGTWQEEAPRSVKILEVVCLQFTAKHSLGRRVVRQRVSDEGTSNSE